MGIDQKDAHHTDPAITTVWGRFYLYASRWLGLLRVGINRIAVGQIVIRLVVVGRIILGQRLLRKVGGRVNGVVARWRRCYRPTGVIIHPSPTAFLEENGTEQV
jgi:hypothetical protein